MCFFSAKCIRICYCSHSNLTLSLTLSTTCSSSVLPILCNETPSGNWLSVKYAVSALHYSSGYFTDMSDDCLSIAFADL